MINPKRIAELREWAACGKRNDEVGAESASISRTQEYHRKRAKNWADLLAILSDHQAALPLLDEIEQAGMISNTKKHPGNYLHFVETDAEKILGSAMTWKNRPGTYKESGGHRRAGPRYDPACDCPDCRKERSQPRERRED